MIGAITNHLWQSTSFVLAAGLAAAALRTNGAHVRHRIWLIASLKFFVPFAVLISAGSALSSLMPAATKLATQTTPDLSVVVDQIAEPFASDVFVPSLPAAVSATTNCTMIIFAGLWACGFVVVASMRLSDWRRVRAALRASTPVPLEIPVPVRSSPGLLEPGVVGLLRPVLLVPAGIERQLTSKQLEAVLAHELCHVRRRDNLTSAIHMVVETIFWFHPLVWFVGARLIDERERACDEHVLRTCGEPYAYAEGILSVCNLYVESPLACVSGVTGADLKKRIAAIMLNRVGLPLNFARRVSLTVAATLAVFLPLAAGTLIAPLGASALAQATADSAAQTAASKFDVVSVKPCEATADVEFGRRGGHGAARPVPAAEPAGASESPGRLFLHCDTLELLIAQAYFGDASRHAYVTGGPVWMTSNRYDVEAKADGTPSDAVLRGPMLRALLEDRFKLTLHRETRDMPVYVLLTTQRGSKLSPLPEGSCPSAKDLPSADATGKTDPRGCGTLALRYTPSNNQLDVHGMTVGAFATVLGGYAGLDRPVVDRTGIAGVFDFHLRYARDSVSVDADAGPSIFRAVQEQLGLKLEATKGAGDFLVIDHVERPTPNDAADASTSAGR